MLKRFLEYEIRKDLKKLNKKINEYTFSRSLPFKERLIHIAKNNKKKIVFILLASVLSKVYDLHKSFYYYVITIESPYKKLHRYIYAIPSIESTILEQNTISIQLPPSIISFLIQLYYQCDQRLYFGVGRKYLFDVYQQLGLLQKPQQQRNFWTATGFYKQRNQMASGVGCVEFVKLFNEGFNKLKQTNPNITLDEFLNKFVDIMTKQYPKIKEWEVNFNLEREEEFLKNDPNDNEKKKLIIMEILKDTPQLTQQQLIQKIRQKGLKGINLNDKYLYWNVKDTWFALKKYYLLKKITDLTVSTQQSFQLQSSLKLVEDQLKYIQDNKQAILKQYQRLYGQQLL